MSFLSLFALYSIQAKKRKKKIDVSEREMKHIMYFLIQKKKRKIMHIFVVKAGKLLCIIELFKSLSYLLVSVSWMILTVSAHADNVEGHLEEGGGILKRKNLYVSLQYVLLQFEGNHTQRCFERIPFPHTFETPLRSSLCTSPFFFFYLCSIPSACLGIPRPSVLLRLSSVIKHFFIINSLPDNIVSVDSLKRGTVQ